MPDAIEGANLKFRQAFGGVEHFRRFSIGGERRGKHCGGTPDDGGHQAAFPFAAQGNVED